MAVKLKKIKTKCQVKGCRSTGNKVDTFVVSASSEFGGIVMCKNCIKGAYDALMEMQKADKVKPKEAVGVSENPKANKAGKKAEAE